MKTITIYCPVCELCIETKDNKQVTCSRCGSWFPAKWARKLELFETQRQAISPNTHPDITISKHHS